MIRFPAAEGHRPLAGTKLYFFVTGTCFSNFPRIVT